MNLGQVAKMVQGTATRRRAADVGAAQPVGRGRRPILESRDEDSVLGAAVRRAGRRRRQPRRDGLEGAARVRRIAQGEGIRQDRHAQHRREHRDRERADFHRRDDRLPLPGVRFTHRQAALGDGAARVRAHRADDVPRQGSAASTSSSPPAAAAISARRPARRSWRSRCRDPDRRSSSSSRATRGLCTTRRRRL